MLFDTHCHLDLPELAAEQAMHWQAARKLGVRACLIPAVRASAWVPLLQLKRQQAAFHIALGIHPWWAAAALKDDLELLHSLLNQHQADVVAVGEIGLDFALDPVTFSTQQQLFSVQLQLAQQFHKPVILHHRKSQPQLLAELKRVKFQQGGILHAFSGSVSQAKAFIDLGFKLGIGGTISYPRAVKTRRTVSQLPLDVVVLETDAPAMPLFGAQGQLNTPAQLVQVFQHFCQLRSESPADIQQQLWQNSLQILGLNQGK